MSGEPPAGETGHRILPHTADLRIEAWGPTRIACLDEAVRALVASFADVSDVPATELMPIQVEPGPNEEILVSLLEEVIYVVDVFGAVPVNAVLEEAEDGGLAGSFDVAPVSAIRVAGPAPKAVARQDLTLGREGERWVARATIDV